MNGDYMSKPARAFLEQPAPEDLGPLSPETIEAYRKMAKDEFLPRAERAVQAHGVTVAEVEIGGVPCLEILPRGEPIGTVLYCYGGGYVTGSAREDLIVSAGLARHSGARVVAVQYRLAPEHPYPAAIDDGAAVYDVLSREAAPFAIAGESAGGNMALALMQRAKANGLPMPVTAVLLSPWCDLTHGGDSLHANDGRDPTLDLAFVEAAAAHKKAHVLSRITASTVDAFQGNERRAIIYDLTSRRPGKPHEDHRRLNVSLTRAQDLLVLIGSRAFVRKDEENPYYASLQRWPAAATIAW